MSEPEPRKISGWERFWWGKKGRPPPRVIDYKEFHEQALLAFGFLGALMFAGLILLLQSDVFADQVAASQPTLALVLGTTWAEYLAQMLETLLGCLIVISAVAAFLCVYASSIRMENPRGPKVIQGFVDACLLIVLLGIGQVVGLILLPYTANGGIVVEVIFLAFWTPTAFLFVWARRPPKSP